MRRYSFNDVTTNWVPEIRRHCPVKFTIWKFYWKSFRMYQLSSLGTKLTCMKILKRSRHCIHGSGNCCHTCWLAEGRTSCNWTRRKRTCKSSGSSEVLPNVSSLVMTYVVTLFQLCTKAARSQRSLWYSVCSWIESLPSLYPCRQKSSTFQKSLYSSVKQTPSFTLSWVSHETWFWKQNCYNTSWNCGTFLDHLRNRWTKLMEMCVISSFSGMSLTSDKHESYLTFSISSHHLVETRMKMALMIVMFWKKLELKL